MTGSSITMKYGKRRVLLLFLCLFLLLGSGRMDSGDANAELAGSFNLVQTGSLGSATPYADPLIQSLFVHAPDGKYYEAHDIGNSVLLSPAALGGELSAAGVSRILRSPALTGSDRVMTLIAKTLGSLLETALSAIACFYLFLLFKLCYSARAALILTLLFAFATFYTAYFRTGWDVLPACNAVILLLYYSAKLSLSPSIRIRDAVPVALWLGMVCLFRFSLAPFLGLGVAILFWGVRKRMSLPVVVVSVATASAMMVPTLVFNAIRTGSPIRSAGTLPQFRDQTSLTGHIAQGMFGLLLSPNRGLFIFSPVLLLLILIPWYWRSIPAVFRSLLSAYIPAAFFYYLMISKLLNWGAAGWGPRYLLPVLPILFLGAAAIAYQLWYQSQSRRFLVAMLCATGFALAIPTLLVDYSNAVLQYPDAFSGSTAYPIQHIAVWQTLGTALHGKPLKARANVGSDEESKLLTVFPDLLVMRVYQVVAGHSRAAAIFLLALYVATLGLVVSLLWSSVSGVFGKPESADEIYTEPPFHERARA